MPDETVASLARLYLGNILYALEVAATSLEADGKTDNAAYCRGIGRKLAEAHGREKKAEQQGRERQADQPVDS